jgi:chromosome transmission fidelity protein 18
VLDQELTRTIALRESQARQSRFQAGGKSNDGAPPSTAEAKTLASLLPKVGSDSSTAKAKMVKRDFFGRVIEVRAVDELDGQNAEKNAQKQRKVWVTYHEGLNNAVTKPMTLSEFLKPL